MAQSKHFLFILTILSLGSLNACKSTLTFSQYYERNEVLKQANRAFDEKKYERTISLALNGPLAEKDDVNTLTWKYELLAKSYFKLKNLDSAYFYIRKGFAIGDIWPDEVLAWKHSRVKDEESGEELYTLPYYPKRPMHLNQYFAPLMPWIFKDYRGYKDQYLAKVDTQLRSEMVIMIQADQEKRRTYLTQRSPESIQGIDSIDRVSHIWLTSYVNKHGWPGPQKRGYHSLGIHLIPAHNDTETGNLFYLDHMLKAASKGKERWHEALALMQDHYVNLAMQPEQWAGVAKLHYIKHSFGGKIHTNKSFIQMVSLSAFLENKYWPISFFLSKKDMNRRWTSKRTAELVVFQYPDEKEKEVTKYMKGLQQIYDYMINELGVSKEYLSISTTPYYVENPEGVRVRFGAKTAVRIPPRN